jgi:hypothetical protein
MQLKRLAILALLAAGCHNQTGIELKVSNAASPTSVEQGVASLELITAHQSFCERWVRDQTASGTMVPMDGRDLGVNPYVFFIHPSPVTDLNDSVFGLVLARDGAGNVIGFAAFGDHPFRKGEVNQYSAEIEYLVRKDNTYAADNCACIPGVPRIGGGGACNAGVVTSFDRLVDTAGCELPAGARHLTSPVCDGEEYPVTFETHDRALPCFAAASGGGCQTSTRNCVDRYGISYDHECLPESADPTLPSGKLCDAYTTCERQTCGDVIGCFLQAVPATYTITCTMKVDPTTPAGMPVKACNAGKWEAVLPPQGAALAGAGCVSTVIEGTIQNRFTLGLKAMDPTRTEPQTRSTLCPPTLEVAAVAAKSPADVPDKTDVELTIGDSRVTVHINVVKDCSVEPTPLVCHL